MNGCQESQMLEDALAASPTILISQKKCTKCKKKKTLLEFYRNKRTKDGLGVWCKSCVIESQKRYTQTEKGKLVHKRACAKYRKNHRKDKAAYYQANKSQISIKNRDKYKKGKVHIIKRVKAYNKTAKGKLVHKKACVKYLQSDQGKYNTRKARYKRRALEANVRCEDFNPIDVFERDGYVCQLCGKKTRPDFKNPSHSLFPNLDHIVPLSKGGVHTKLNTQCLCRQCNIEKSSTGKGDQLRMFS